MVKTVKLGRGMGESNNFMVKLWDSLHDTQWNIGITLWNALTVGEECLLCLFKWYSKTQYNADAKCLWWRMSYPQSLHTSESHARSFGVDMDQDDWSEITGITVYQEKGIKAHSLSCNDSRRKFFAYVSAEWTRKICKPKFNGLCVNGIFFFIVEEFFDDFTLVEASSSKDDEILFFLLISSKELKEKAMPYKKHLRQLKCKREDKFSD